MFNILFSKLFSSLSLIKFGKSLAYVSILSNLDSNPDKILIILFLLLLSLVSIISSFIIELKLSSLDFPFFCKFFLSRSFNTGLTFNKLFSGIFSLLFIFFNIKGDSIFSSFALKEKSFILSLIKALLI
jgi:hypothetical protein